MPRRFNTAGPCDPNDHYMLSPLRRLPSVRRLVDEKAYFVLHAPRQSGKSTAMMALARELTAEGRYVGAYLDVKVGSTASHDPGAAEDAILSQWRRMARFLLPANLQPPPWPESPPRGRIADSLSAWAASAPRPLVAFLDEFDALRDETLLAVLDQLRSGYPLRPRGFPWSLALIGLRDVHDYRVGDGRLGSSSPFNIKIESLTLREFNRDEVAELYDQHTAETGQVFAPDAVDRVFDLTQGQPWLVNALARQLVEVVVPDCADVITPAHVERAREILIVRQDTHLDSLAERLREERVRRVVEPILAGEAMPDIPHDDLVFVQDLGLARMGRTGGLEIANPIYREVIPRVLAATPAASLPRIAPTWLRDDGALDPDRLLDAFIDFWRRHGEPLMGGAPYHEIAPHLVLMAFLHRVVNGGGTIEREYAIGSRRMDLCVKMGGVVLAMELKVWRDGRPDPLAEGLAQLDAYLAGLGLDWGWLVVFDRRSGQPPIAERTTREDATTPGGREVKVVRA